MTTFKGTRWVVASALLLAVVSLAQPRAATRAWITVLGTTDQHGNLLPIDYYTGKPDQRGLAKIATLVKRHFGEIQGATSAELYAQVEKFKATIAASSGTAALVRNTSPNVRAEGPALTL